MNTFTVDIADAALDDLHLRLERTRFARPTPGPPGQAGISPDYLRELVDYWLRRFDWRQLEARINAFPQFTAEVRVAEVATSTDSPTLGRWTTRAETSNRRPGSGHPSRSSEDPWSQGRGCLRWP